MHVLIAGGGLGGLVLAGALIRAGKRVTVLERDPGPGARPQGLIIGLRQEGVSVLLHEGFGPAVEGLFATEGPGSVAMANERGDVLIRGEGWLRVRVGDGPEGDRSSLVDRATLRRALGDALPPNTIRWGARVASVRSEAGRAVAVLEGGEEVEGDVLVGADGARSAVRAAWLPELAPDGLGVWSVAGTARVDAEAPRVAESAVYRESVRSLVRISGRDGASMLVFTPGVADPSIGARRTLWAVSAPMSLFGAAASATTPPDVALAAARRLTSAHFDVPGLPDLVALTDPSTVLAYELTSVAPDAPARVFRGVPPSARITLLGDAAHKTTTQAGLGATGAFLDASDLAAELAGLKEFDPAALRRYEARMAARAARYVGASVGNTRNLHAPLAGWRRRAAMGMMWAVGGILWAVQRVAAMFHWIRKLIVGQ